MELAALGPTGGRMSGWWLYVSVASGARVAEEE